MPDGEVMLKLAKLIAAVVLLSSCAPKTFYKPGASQQEFVTTKYECEKDTRQSNFGGGLAGALSANNFAVECMHAHGWYEK